MLGHRWLSFVTLIAVSCAREPESRLGGSETLDNIVPDSFVPVSDQNTALNNIDTGLALVDSRIGNKPGLGLTGSSQPAIGDVANNADALLGKFVSRMRPRGDSLSLNQSDPTSSLMKPSPGVECRDQIESLPESYTSAIASTKALIQKMKEIGEGKSTGKEKWTVTPAAKGRYDSFAYNLIQQDAPAGKEPLSLLISGGADTAGLYTAKIAFNAPSMMTLQYRFFGDTNNKKFKAVAKLNLLKSPDFDDYLETKVSSQKDPSDPGDAPLKELQADFLARLDLDAATVLKQAVRLKGSFHAVGETGSTDMDLDFDSAAEMPDNNHLNAKHKIVASGHISDAKSGVSNINFDQAATVNYERGSDEKGEYCSINGVKATIPPKTTVATPKPVTIPPVVPDPAKDDRSFSSFTVSEFKATLMNNDVTWKTETVAMPSLNLPPAQQTGLDVEKFRVNYDGTIEILAKDQIIDFAVDHGSGYGALYIDGQIITIFTFDRYTWSEKLTVGKHRIFLSGYNFQKFGSILFNLSITRQPSYSKNEIKEKILATKTLAPKVLYAGVLTSSEGHNIVRVTLPNTPNQTDSYFLVLASQRPVRWEILNPANIKLAGIMFNSAVPKSSLPPAASINKYEVKDLLTSNQSSIDKAKINAEISEIFGVQPLQVKTAETAESLTFGP